MTAYTPAQLRALAWLPEDGGWRSNPGSVRYGLLQLLGLCLVQYGWFVGNIRFFRLTTEGIAERARLAKEGMIK